MLEGLNTDYSPHALVYTGMDTVVSLTISRALEPTGHATGTCRHVGLDYILHLHHEVYAMCNEPDSEWMYYLSIQCSATARQSLIHHWHMTPSY